MRKKKLRLSSIYQAALLVLMYLPIVVVVVYSFNVSKNTTVWGGVTLDWYGKMMNNRGLLEALRNSLVLATLSLSLIHIYIAGIYLPDRSAACHHGGLLQRYHLLKVPGRGIYVQVV